MRTRTKVETRKRREADFWRSVNRLLFVLIGGCVVALTVLWFVPELRKIDEMKANLSSLEKELKDVQLTLLQQQRTVQLLNENPEYLETIARDRLGVMKDGETIYRLDTEMATMVPPGVPSAN